MSGECEWVCKSPDFTELKIFDPEKSKIIFCSEDGEWVMKITHGQGIVFNRERWPDGTPDDFAIAVIEILEKCFKLKFDWKL